MYKVSSPVLFIIFNRPDTTKLVFEKIREVRPKKLYISADGPRKNRENEDELCTQTRNLIKIDWDCEVHTLYHPKNLGCKMAVSTGIKWFFNQEEEGIVLEDDCLPNEDFFRYCDTLLEKYRNDTRIVHISGTCMNFDQKYGDATYYFSKYTNIWGWASWKRVWKDYDEDIHLLDDFMKENLVENLYPYQELRESFIKAIYSIKNKTIDTWDYQYAFLNLWNNGLCINPNYNMISNIGFNETATHTKDLNNRYANLRYNKFEEIKHPKFFVPRLEADYNTFKLENPGFWKRMLKKLN